MNVLKYSLIFPLMLCTMPAFAADIEASHFTQMKGADLESVFENTIMIGEYRTYRGETKTFNYTELHSDDGKTDYKEGRKHEDGRWRIIGGDKICYKYPKSNYYTATYCFFVYENDKCYYKYSLRSMTIKGPRSWDAWASRAIRKGSGGSCAAPIG